MEYPVFICDDDASQVARVSQIIKSAEVILSDEETVKFNLVEQAATYAEAAAFLKANPLDGGIYILDIELGKSVSKDNGFDLAEQIKRQDERAQIIFFTTHDDLSIITFRRRLGPIDYIVKTDDLDVLKKRLTKTLEVAIYQLSKFNVMKEMTFSYKVGRNIRNVNIDNIYYIKTTQTPHKLQLVLKDGQREFFGFISKIAKENPMLVKISQSCIINPKNLENVDTKNYKVEFANGDEQYYSRSVAKEMKDLIKQYNLKNASEVSKFNGLFKH